jgi:hypothetical protein
MYTLSKKELKRYDELYQKAIAQYLDKTDFDACEYLEPKESNELADLMQKEQGE